VDRVVREELFELAVKLSRQGLVVREHKRRPPDGLNDVRHGERLAAAGDAHQHLIAPIVAQPADQGLDGLRLVAGGLKRTDELKLHACLRVQRRAPVRYSPIP